MDSIPFFIPLISGPEQRRADAQVMGAFLDGGLEIQGHAHGEGAQVAARLRVTEPISQGLQLKTQFAEARPRCLRPPLSGAHGHKADEPEIGRGRKGGHRFGKTVGRKPRFLRLTRSVQLEKYVAPQSHFPRHAIQGLPEIGRMYGMDGRT